MWFWEILGIEPTDDKTAIKRAYTKLAHDTNPEDDPEGYAKLHEAYRAALDYAAGRVVEVVDPVVSDGVSDGVSAGVKRSEFDFTSVNDMDQAEALDPTELKNYIHEFKVATKTFSYEEIFNRPQKELHDLAIRLYSMYSALVIKSDDLGIWNDFFKEPLINMVMNDTEFRYFMENSFPEGNINKFIISGFVDNYEQGVANRIQEKARNEEIEETFQKKEHARIWRVAGLVSVIIGLALIMADAYFALYVYQFLSIGSNFIGFALCCGARYYDLRLKVTGSQDGSERLVTVLYKLLSVVFIACGWATIFAYGTLSNIYGKAAIVISSITTIAAILLFTVFRPRLKKR